MCNAAASFQLGELTNVYELMDMYHYSASFTRLIHIQLLQDSIHPTHILVQGAANEVV
jgi:hypothetical protein